MADKTTIINIDGDNENEKQELPTWYNLAEGFDKLGASPMLPMNIILNDQEIADVMAYLLTLKEKKN